VVGEPARVLVRGRRAVHCQHGRTRLVVEALLAPLKRVPRERYLWPNAGKPRPEPAEPTADLR
jgi:hypothetical protein